MSQKVQVQVLMKRLEDNKIKYSELKKDLIELDNIINHLTKLIYDNCDHNWEVDHTISDEHTTHICTKCNLIR
jgi:hypothetical protein